MTKRLLAAALAAILTLSLAACGDNSSTPAQSANLPSASSGGDNVLETDFQKDMHQNHSSIYVCETENGYYFEHQSLVYYMEKATGAVTILCGKPECSHNTPDCNAYVHSTFLTYYDGKIYYTNDDYVYDNGSYVDKGLRLYSMELDGTSHDVVQELEFVPSGNTSNYVTEPIIHRGMVYFEYSGQLYAAPLGSDIEDAVLIYGEAQANNGSGIFNTYGLHYELWADGDNIYFMAKNAQQSDGTYKDILFCYNPLAAEIKEVWKVPDQAEVGIWDATGVSVTQWYILGGYIYFYLSGNGIWYTELSTGQTSKLADVNLSSSIASFSEEYIAVMSKNISGVDAMNNGSALSGGDTLYIYNYNGELVKEISLQKIYDDDANIFECGIDWIADGEIYILANATVAEVNTGAIPQYYLYAVDIASGSVEITDWFYSYAWG